MQSSECSAFLLFWSMTWTVKVGSTETKVDFRESNFDSFHQDFYDYNLLTSWWNESKLDSRKSTLVSVEPTLTVQVIDQNKRNAEHSDDCKTYKGKLSLNLKVVAKRSSESTEAINRIFYSFYLNLINYNVQVCPRLMYLLVFQEDIMQSNNISNFYKYSS